MKKLLIALMLVSGMAQADTFATLPNNAGGKIVLTDETCKLGEKTYEKLNRAYNYGSAGYTSEGCWMVEDETVVVVWVNSKDKMRYPIANFTLSPNWKQKPKSKGYTY